LFGIYLSHDGYNKKRKEREKPGENSRKSLRILRKTRNLRENLESM
jgi:hypothetical protein